MMGMDSRQRVVTWAALLFAMVFPTVAAWTYFLGLAVPGRESNPAQQAGYVLGKVIQFTFPIVFLLVARRPWPRPTLPGRRGMGVALAFGLLVAGLILGAYFVALRHSSLMARTPAMVREKLLQAGMATSGRFLALGAFIVLVHSLAEEYYWRWFVYGQLRQLTPRGTAIALSGVAFAAHHVVVLYVYLPQKFMALALPFSVAIAVGGAVWAWLYDYAGTLWPSWLSHLLIDAAIMVVGWDLLMRASAA